MNKLKFFISKTIIPSETKLRYLITIPCVNREERNAVNVIERTFESFEKSGLFESNIELSILLFESGSVNKSYLDFLEKYKEKYCNNTNTNTNIKIQIIHSTTSLNGVSNTLRMFFYLSKLPKASYNFIIWMDDDVFVCKNFIKNADIWIKNYANFSLFSSLYVPYNTTLISDKKYVSLFDLPAFYGTCCTIFKPELSNYVLPHWYNDHFQKFEYNPDTRFRDSLKKEFPNVRKILVSSFSLVEHMNIGSAIKMKKVVNKGHKAIYFIGEENDPELYKNIN